MSQRDQFIIRERDDLEIPAYDPTISQYERECLREQYRKEYEDALLETVAAMNATKSN